MRRRTWLGCIPGGIPTVCNAGDAMQLYLRDADGSDLPHLLAVLSAEATPLDVDAFDHVGDYADALREIERTPGTYVLMADYSGAAVAFVQLVTYRRLPQRGGRCAVIESLIVAHSWRRRGVGTQLLDHAIGRAIDMGCHEVRVEFDHGSDPARAVFGAAGFEMTSEGGRRSLDLDWTPTRSTQHRWAPDAATV